MLRLEQLLEQLTATQKAITTVKEARENELNRQQAEYAKAAESRNACIAVVADNIKALRNAEAAGTVATLVPPPPQYTPPPAPTPPPTFLTNFQAKFSGYTAAQPQPL